MTLMTYAWGGQGMALRHSRWPLQGWDQRIRFVLILCSVFFVSQGLVHHDHDNLCADRPHTCHTHGCWGFLLDSESPVAIVMTWLSWWQQYKPSLDHLLSVFHPPRPLLLQLS